jgi:hypothetical protein
MVMNACAWRVQLWFRTNDRGWSTPRRSLGLRDCYSRAQSAGAPVLGYEELETWLPRSRRYEYPCVTSHAADTLDFWQFMAAHTCPPERRIFAACAYHITTEAGIQ